MTLKQFDSLYLTLQSLVEQDKRLANEVQELTVKLAQLENKTVVVTSLDQDIEKLKVDVAALIDERRA